MNETSMTTLYMWKENTGSDFIYTYEIQKHVRYVHVLASYLIAMATVCTVPSVFPV